VGSGGRTGTGGSSSAAGATGGSTASGGTSSAGGGGGGATNTGNTVVDCNDASTTTKNFTKQYEDGSLAVTGSTKTYWTMTNWWHKFGGQTVSLNGLSLKVGNSQSASVPDSDGNPMGFPSIFIGTYQTKATVGSNLPKKVTDIKSAPTVFQTNATSLDTSNMNATYDVWFTATGDPLSNPRASGPGPGGAYLMVWMYKPEKRQPRGGVGGTTGASPNFPATTVNGVPGKWDVWVDSKSDPPCISYVSSTPIDGLAFDLNNFIQDSITNKYGVTASMYLSLIFGGFEIWAGGDGLELKKFCAAVN
jgi:endoglucanase